jgi:phosphate starvation-inducible membrane PsiE
MFESLFCEKLGTENKYILLYCESGYRSWGKGFILIFEIINEICQYLTDNTHYSVRMYIYYDLYNQLTHLVSLMLLILHCEYEIIFFNSTIIYNHLLEKLN